LDGGLNLWELDYRLNRNQSPEMKNLWWQDGVLQCRDGQEYVYGPQMIEDEHTGVWREDPDWIELGTGYTCFHELFWDNAFFHIGDKIYRMEMEHPERTLIELAEGIPQNRGTFFRYNDYLFYKNRGGFFKIEYDTNYYRIFRVTDATDGAYTPTTILNAAPATGSGDLYQPENRLSAKKKVQYNAAVTTELKDFTGDGAAKVFDTGKTAAADHLVGVEYVYVSGAVLSDTAYTFDASTGKIEFVTPPASNAPITLVLQFGVTTYKLPVRIHEDDAITKGTLSRETTEGQTEIEWTSDVCIKSVDGAWLTGTDHVTDGVPAYTATIVGQNVKITFAESQPAGIGLTFDLTIFKNTDWVEEVVVDGKSLTEGIDYLVNPEDWTIEFKAPPPVHNPAVNNTVEVTYSKRNNDALKSIMDCPYAIVYGGDTNISIILGGSTAQPNAFFWNGNDDLSMNESYWPMSFYQLAGDTEDTVTGFGRQYNTLLVFKERSVGKALYGVETVDGRDNISYTYASINARIGCDLPWTIQLIENNVVFCNTQGGVHVVRDSTSALENNIECISRNVNGTEQRPGLLQDVRVSGAAATCSFDDSNRYWVCANGRVYVWDYLLSSWKEPSWFLFTGVNGIAYLRTVDKSYHLNSAGRVTLFKRSFVDYNNAIEKVYQFPPQFFDTYDRLKDVLYCIFTVRSDTDTEVDIMYQSDYENRPDPTPIKSFSWKLTPRNLAYRCLSVPKFAHVAKRKPGCRHVRHFSMRLTNNKPVQDLAILSAQIYFRYLGRDR
jgi:hypothetical protein